MLLQPNFLFESLNQNKVFVNCASNHSFGTTLKEVKLLDFKFKELLLYSQA